MTTLPVVASAAPALRARWGPEGWNHPTRAMVGIALLAIGLVGVATGLRPIAGLGAAAMVAGGLVVLFRPRLGGLLLIGLVPAIGGLRRGLPVPGLRASEAIVVGIAAIVLLTADARTPARWRLFDWLTLLYAATWFGLGLADVLLQHDTLDRTTLGILLGPLQFFLLYRAARVALPRPEDRRRALRWMLLASIPVALLALAQRFAAGVVSPFLSTIIDQGDLQAAAGPSGRASGPFPHGQVLAAYLFVVLVVAIALAFERERRVLGNRALVVVVSIAAAAMISTGTFVTALGVIAAALILGAMARRLSLLATGLGLATLLTGALFGSYIAQRYQQQFARGAGVERSAWVPQSVDYRARLWKNSYLPLISRYAERGYGPQAPPNSSFPYTETMYLTLVLHGGVPLLVVYLVLMGALVGGALRRARAPDPFDRAVARALVAIGSLILVMQFLEPYTTFGGFAHALWGLAALVFAASPVLRTARAPRVAVPSRLGVAS